MLARPLQKQSSKVRLLIRGDRKLFGPSVVVIQPCNDQRVFSEEYWLSHKPSQSITEVTDAPEGAETTYTVDLTFKEHFTFTDIRQPREPGGYLHISEPPPPQASESLHETKPPLWDELYEYQPESPIFIALESTHRIIDADNDCDVRTLFNFNFHVVPALHFGINEKLHPNVVTICDLPTELLLLVSHHAVPHELEWRVSKYSYSQTLLSLSLVNRRFNSVFLPALYSAFGPGYIIAIHPDNLEGFAASLASQPSIRQYFTRFTYEKFPKGYETEEVKLYSQIFSIATSISHMAVPYVLFDRIAEQVSKLAQMETFRLVIARQEYEKRQVFPELYDTLYGWPALTKLEISQFEAHPTEIERNLRVLRIGAAPSKREETPKKRKKPRFSLTELRLSGGKFTPIQTSAILASSKSSLQLLCLHEVTGLTNGDLLGILLNVGPSLTKLQVTQCQVASDSTGNLAIDSVLSHMRNLTKLLVTDNFVTPACLSAKQSCPYHRHSVGCGTEPCCSITVDVPVQRVNNTKWDAKALTEELRLKPTQLVTAGGDQNLGWGRMVIHIPESSNHFTEDMEDNWERITRKRGSDLEVIRGRECKRL